MTWRLIVLQSDDISGPLLEPLQEVDHQVPDVLGIGGLEGELLPPHRHQGEGLREGLAAPAPSDSELN